MAVDTKNWTELLPPTTHARLLNLVRSLTGKAWSEVWELHDVCYLICAAHHHAKCETCKGSGYQNLDGSPGCKGGCEDCAGTGLLLPQ